jgi:hypothetical protein
MKKIVPIELFNKPAELICEVCGKDLFKEPEDSLIIFYKKNNTYTKVYSSCKGECDRKLRDINEMNSSWLDLTDFMNPFSYLKKVMGLINNLNNGIKYEDAAIESYKHILIVTYQYVIRQYTEDEKKSFIELNSLGF